MPVYEYLCDKGHETEVEQSIKDDALTECLYYTDKEKRLASTHCAQECGAPCRRLIPNTSFKFKGGPPTPKYHT
jgi:predicted nucleic acid-binding Zn ribbon protein